MLSSQGCTTMPRLNTLQIYPQITRQRITLIVGGITMVNSLLLLSTLVFIFSPEDSRNLADGLWGGGIQAFLPLFNLAQENNFASWYSSILLLAISTLALLCFLADLQYEERKEYRQLNFGWLAISTIFFLLSADEMGSFHERIGMLNVLPTDKALGWVPIFEIPIGLMAGLLAIFSWLKMSRYRSAMILSIVGIGLYIINPTLEELQNILLRSSSLTTAQQQLYNMSLLLEEGAELFGSLAFLSALLLYCGHRLKTFKTSDTQSASSLKIDISMVTLLNIMSTWIGALVFSMVSLQRLNIQAWQGDSGIPSNWFPAATAFLAGLICLVNLGNADKQSKPQSYLHWTYASFCLALSLYYGLHAPHVFSNDLLSQNFSIGHLQRLFIIVAVLLNLWLSSQTKRWEIKLGIWIWPLLLGLTFHLHSTGIANLVDLGAMISLLTILIFQLYHSPQKTLSEA